MCGIAGTIGAQEIQEYIINKTLDVLKKRGPNARGFVRKKIKNIHLNLLHTRLTIIDPSPLSNQPFERDDIILVFNGEIYNYIELSKILKSKGYNFKTKSDTEVLICSYLEWGLEFVSKLEGMWSFALYDLKKGVLHLSRDRFGEKPLFFLNDNNTLYFGSEGKAISALLNRKLEINIPKIKSYMINGFRSIFKDKKTFFKNVFEVQPGEIISINLNLNVKKKRYWDLKYNPKEITKKKLKSELREKLFNSMKLCLRSDVPLAFCLSGGIDSTSLASMAKKIFNYDVNSFSVIDDDERYNEYLNINKTINDLDCNSYFSQVSKISFFENMKEIISYFEAPIPTISYYVHNFLSKMVSQKGFKVVISGTGADEIFSGYYDHYRFWLYENANTNNFDNLIKDWKNTYGRWENNPLLKNITNFKNKIDIEKHLYQNNKYFNSLMIDPIDLNFEEENYSENFLRNRMLNELNHEIVPVILRADDMNSMMYSVENRSPFLDKNLVEFAYQIPNHLLIQNGYPKWPLRESMREIVTKQVLLDTRKRGFNASILSLVDLKDRNIVDKLINDSPIFDIVDKKRFIEFLNNDLYDNSLSKFLFSFVSSKIFLETYS